MREGGARPAHRGAYWLPVLLAASFPLIAIRWGSDHRASEQLPVQASATERLALPALFSPEIQHWTLQIQRWAVEHQLPAELIATVMQIESCGHPTVSSSAGALGLFQVMPFHFAAGESPFEPEVNAQRGLAYLARALELAQGDRRLALAGYNGGHAIIGRPSESWPAETRRYVEWGGRILDDVDQGLQASPALQAWLDAGGAVLCRRATEYLELS